MVARSDQSKRARGRWGEDRACRQLRRAGYEILDRNWRSPERSVLGELDIVAATGDAVVFCEVKARRQSSFGGAASAVDVRKQKQIRRLAESWLRSNERVVDRVRFDVIAIDGVRLEHLVSAF
ncbi:YraN family protein [Ilumatobacter sp.]|uniref:YraN family protein n=1 Tax=Ilumatobacter sp. TaxID=1967498 RepID=UPI003AF74F11